MRRLSVLLLLLPSVFGCEVGDPPLVDRPGFDHATWSWENPRPLGSELLAVASGSGEHYAVGRSGAVLRWAGSGWGELASPFPETLLDVMVLGPAHILVVGDAGRIAEWRNGTWTPHDSGTTRALAGLAVDPQGQWIAVGDLGTRLRFEAGVWVPMADDDLQANLESIHVTDAGVHYAVSTPGSILRSPDGFTWSVDLAPAPGSLLLDVTGWGEWVYACGIVAGVAAVMVRGAEEWTVVRTGGQVAPYTALAGTGPQDLYVLGQAGVVESYDGAAWVAEEVTGAARHALWDLGLDASGTLRVVGSHGGVFRRDPGGAWNRTTDAVAPGSLLWSATLDATGGLWLVGDQTILDRPRDSILRLQVGPAANWFGVAAAGEDLVLVGERGRAARLGAAWADIDPPLGEEYDLRDVWAFGPDEWVTVGTDGTILAHDANGWRFEREPAVQSPDWNALWARDRDFVVAVGEEGAVTIRVGGQWVDQDPLTIADLNDVWGTGPSDLFVVGARGAILDYDGADWRHQALFVTTEEDFLTGIGGRARDDLFVVGNRTRLGLPSDGVVFRYDGRAWARDRVVQGVGLSDLAVDQDGTVWVAGSGGTVWRNGN